MGAVSCARLKASRTFVATVGVVFAATSCSASGAAGTSAADDARAKTLEAAQQRLTSQALDTLNNRSCPPAPEATVLAGLPDAPLACLGTGPARGPSAGDGRPTVVNLWASWCPPCVDEMPLLQRTAERAGEAVRFVGIDTQDEPASAAALLEATGVRYEQYDDPDATVRTAARVVGLPVTLVFDARGRELDRRVGRVDAAWMEQALGRAEVQLAPGS